MAYGFYHRKKGSKYGNEKTVIDNIKFDSKHEAERYCQLRLLERAGVIRDLELQKKFVLIPAQFAPDTVTITKRGKEKIVKGKCLERECAYLCDFAYIDCETGEQVVEDCKSPITRTAVYKVKKKLMLERYGICIVEI